MDEKLSKSGAITTVQLAAAGTGFIGAATVSYYYFFQAPSVFSWTYLAIAASAGVFAAVVGVFAVRGKSWLDVITDLRKYWLLSSILLVISWDTFSVPQNYLFAPKVDLEIEIQAQDRPGGIVEVLWLQSGMGDVSFKDVSLNSASTFSSQSIRLVLDKQSSAQLAWSGRAWKEIAVLLRSDIETYRMSARLQPGASTANFQIDSSGEKDLHIPVRGAGFYRLVNLLVYLGTVFAVIFLLITVPWDKLAQGTRNLPNLFSETFRKHPFTARLAGVAKFPDAAWLILLSSAVMVFFILTQRPGHYWSGDYAMYLQHADNIANHRPYIESHYLYNPQMSGIGPAAYPPGYPLAIAPLLAIFGLKWGVLKAFNVSIFALTLPAIYFLFKAKVNKVELWLILLLVAIQPAFFLAKENVLSDLLFFFCFIDALVVLQYFASARKQTWISALICGIVLYIPYAVRTIGIVIVPAFLLAAIFKERKVSAWLLGTVTFAAGLILLQGALLPGITSYADSLRVSWASIKTNVQINIQNLSDFFYSREFSAAEVDLLVVLFFLMAPGLIEALIRDASILEFVCAGYLSTVIIWPYNQGTRFFLPVFPLLVYYLLKGFALIARRVIKLRTAAPIFIGLLVFTVFFSYFQFYSNIPRVPPNENILDSGFVDMFAFVRESTQPQDVIVFARPRTMGFFARRDSAAVNWQQPDRAIWDYLQSISADYVAVTQSGDQEAASFIHRYPDQFERVYTNSNFEIYHFK